MNNQEKTMDIALDVNSRRAMLLAKVTAYVQSHIATQITLKQIAAHCGVSVSTITTVVVETPAISEICFNVTFFIGISFTSILRNRLR